MNYFYLADVHLSLDTLKLINWKDKKGNIKKFRLVARVSKKWRAISRVLRVNMNEYDDIFHEKVENAGKDALSFCCLMEKWLLAKGSPSYPATWKGLHSLLKDSDVPSETLKQLKKAVVFAILPICQYCPELEGMLYTFILVAM